MQEKRWICFLMAASLIPLTSCSGDTRVFHIDKDVARAAFPTYESFFERGTCFAGFSEDGTKYVEGSSEVKDNGAFRVYLNVKDLDKPTYVITEKKIFNSTGSEITEYTTSVNETKTTITSDGSEGERIEADEGSDFVSYYKKVCSIRKYRTTDFRELFPYFRDAFCAQEDYTCPGDHYPGLICDTICSTDYLKAEPFKGLLQKYYCASDYEKLTSYDTFKIELNNRYWEVFPKHTNPYEGTRYVYFEYYYGFYGSARFRPFSNK